MSAANPTATANQSVANPQESSPPSPPGPRRRRDERAVHQELLDHAEAARNRDERARQGGCRVRNAVSPRLGTGPPKPCRMTQRPSPSSDQARIESTVGQTSRRGVVRSRRPSSALEHLGGEAAGEAAERARQPRNGSTSAPSMRAGDQTRRMATAAAPGGAPDDTAREPKAAEGDKRDHTDEIRSRVRRRRSARCARWARPASGSG